MRNTNQNSVQWLFAFNKVSHTSVDSHSYLAGDSAQHYFLNQWTPSCLEATLSCLACFFFASCFVCVLVILSISYMNIGFTLSRYIIFPKLHCANQLQPIVISMYWCGSFWGVQDKARRDKARHCVASARQDGWPLVLKNNIAKLWRHMSITDTEYLKHTHAHQINLVTDRVIFMRKPLLWETVILINTERDTKTLSKTYIGRAMRCFVVIWRLYCI